MSRFPNSMERMAEEGARRGAEERARVQRAHEEWLDWAMRGLPEGANLSLSEAYFAGWYQRHRNPVDESKAAQEPAPQAAPADRESEIKLRGDLTIAIEDGGLVIKRLDDGGVNRTSLTHQHGVRLTQWLRSWYDKPAPAREPAALDIREAAMAVYNAFYGPNPGNTFAAWVALLSEKVNGLGVLTRKDSDPLNGSAIASPTAPRSEIREAHPFHDFGFEPGGYMCVCVRCKEEHQADKRAWRCFECAAKLYVESLREALETSGSESVTEGNRPDPSPSPSPVVPPVDVIARWLPTSDEANRVVDGLLADQHRKEKQGAPVDGEAGDLWDADSEREDFDAWIKATPCKAQWTRRHIAWLAWLERAGRAARLSPAPKQGREWELKGFAYLQGGTMSGVNCGPALKIGETVRVREVDGGATGGEAGNGAAGVSPTEGGAE